MGTVDEEDDVTIYDVVINREEQYSIWAAHLPDVAGWTRTGVRGSKRECLGHIQQVWTDMRPLSLRKDVEQVAAQRDSGAPSVPHKGAIGRGN